MASPARGKCLLQSLLDKADMTQTKLAEKTGISQRMISYYAADESIMSVDAARAISTSLKCRIEDLYKWPDLDE
jgi:transcriptional regulator with XRE-family HTH domain